MLSLSNITDNKLSTGKWLHDKGGMKMTIMPDTRILKPNLKSKIFWEKSSKKMLSSPNTTFLIKAVFYILVINMNNKLKISSTTQHYHKPVPVSLLLTILKLSTIFSIIMSILHLGILQEISLHYLQRMLWQ